MKDIIIIGAGDLGREVAELIRDINKIDGPTWNLLGYVDDNNELKGKLIDGHPVLGDVKWLEKQSACAVCAIGNARSRKSVMKKIESFPNIKYASLIHPSSLIASSAQIEEGAVICAGNIVAINAYIGKHAYINLASTIGHDAKIDKYSIVSPGVNISGRVNIGSSSEIGTGASIIQGIEISSDVIVGAGACVIRDINEAGTYVGVPARRSAK